MSFLLETKLASIKNDVTTHQAEVEAFGREKDQKIASDDAAVSKTLHDALSSLNSIIQAARRTDRKVVKAHSCSWPMKTLFKIAGVWVPAEHYLSEGNDELLSFAKVARGSWDASSQKLSMALEGVLALSVKVSTLHGSQVKLETSLDDIEAQIISETSKASDSLSLSEKQIQETNANLILKNKEFLGLIVNAGWADLESTAWQGVGFTSTKSFRR
jgi:hypothetical protein